MNTRHFVFCVKDKIEELLGTSTGFAYSQSEEFFDCELARQFDEVLDAVVLGLKGFEYEEQERKALELKIEN